MGEIKLIDVPEAVVQIELLADATNSLTADANEIYNPTQPEQLAAAQKLIARANRTWNRLADLYATTVSDLLARNGLGECSRGKLPIYKSQLIGPDNLPPSAADYPNVFSMDQLKLIYLKQYESILLPKPERILAPRIEQLCPVCYPTGKVNQLWPSLRDDQPFPELRSEVVRREDGELFALFPEPENVTGINIVIPQDGWLASHFGLPPLPPLPKLHG